MKKFGKTFGYILVVTLVLLVIADQILLSQLIDRFHHQIPRPRGDARILKPYIEFAGRPNAWSHNELGYRWKIDKEPDPNTFNIAFFGGSTGYRGEPPIATLLEQALQAEFGQPVKVANFSVVSGNHRQHLHTIIETHKHFVPDVIIFYGGHNETALHIGHDPRPGHPYNFFYTRETNTWHRLMIENSGILHLINREATRRNWFSLTPLVRLRQEVGVGSAAWNTELRTTYFETLSYANRLAKTFTSTRCADGSKFRAFYQPYQFSLHPAVLAAHEGIRKDLSQLNYAYDVSDALHGREHVFSDPVHLTQEGNEIMAQRLFGALKSDANFTACIKPQAR